MRERRLVHLSTFDRPQLPFLLTSSCPGSNIAKVSRCNDDEVNPLKTARIKLDSYYLSAPRLFHVFIRLSVIKEKYHVIFSLNYLNFVKKAMIFNSKFAIFSEKS